MNYTAIVLRTDAFRESDRTVTLLTKEDGLVRLIAKGSLKSTSKNASSLEPCTLSIVGVAPGKELSYITSMQQEEFFAPVRSDLRKSAAALYAMHLLTRTLKEHDPHERLFEDTCTWLSALSTDTPFQIRMIDAYVLRTLAAIGFAPDISNTDIAFSIADGTCVSAETAKQLLLEKKPVVPVTEEVLLVLHQFMTSSWKAVQEIEINAKTAITVHRIVYEYAQYHLERELADWDHVIHSFE